MPDRPGRRRHGRHRRNGDHLQRPRQRTLVPPLKPAPTKPDRGLFTALNRHLIRRRINATHKRAVAGSLANRTGG
ncbi:hypothetical protein Ate02nite_34380 [Paractinoplanes tereljensis]|uniref:Uncharacterized protein n=1 Tax=Paractinoplanes tereljensis TaxID=571912 RepID=A0A919NLI2_9ACTN|nr:hypothetical protein Ate02nite_34380 [Actinoplanes tereljensis]